MSRKIVPSVRRTEVTCTLWIGGLWSGEVRIWRKGTRVPRISTLGDHIRATYTRPKNIGGKKYQTESSETRPSRLKSIGGQKRLICSFIYRRRTVTQNRQGLKNRGGKRIRLTYCFIYRRRATSEERPDASPLPLYLFLYTDVCCCTLTSVYNDDRRGATQGRQSWWSMSWCVLSPSVLNHDFMYISVNQI
jgi:hypothetical protein